MIYETPYLVECFVTVHKVYLFKLKNYLATIMMKIRLATPDDAQAMLEIYSPYILNSGITQETEVPSVEEFQNRISSYLATYPWLVCEINGKIEGYAYASQHRSRKGYQWCVETSVYIDQEQNGKGIGQALYTALFRILKLQGFVNAYAVITLPNERSVTFHEKFGFHYLFSYKNIGYKLGKWHDVGWLAFLVNEHKSNQPNPVIFSQLEISAVNNILSK